MFNSMSWACLTGRSLSTGGLKDKFERKKTTNVYWDIIVHIVMKMFLFINLLLQEEEADAEAKREAIITIDGILTEDK